MQAKIIKNHSGPLPPDAGRLPVRLLANKIQSIQRCVLRARVPPMPFWMQFADQQGVGVRQW